MQSVDIQSYSYEERALVLSSLTYSFADCGGWVLQRESLSTTIVAFRLEIQLRGVIDLYAATV